MAEIHDALNLIYEKLNEELNSLLVERNLQPVAYFYKGLKPFEFILKNKVPIVIIHYLATTNKKDSEYAWEAETSFNIKFKYPFDLKEAEDVLAKYSEAILEVLTSLQNPNTLLKVFIIDNCEIHEPDLVGEIWWIGFDIKCRITHYFQKEV